jgi:formate hydrogenlyase transcriptional activator
VGAVSFTTVERQYHWSEPVVERMKLVAVILSHALERKRSQMALEERLQFQNLVSKIAKNFIGLSSVELEQARQAALAEIGRYFEVDAVRLYRLSPQGDIIEMRNVWVSEHSVAVEETTEMETMKYPHLAAHYLQGETIVYGCPDECPQLPDLIKILKYAKITAGVGVPLEIDDSGVDVFALAKTQSEHVWPKDIVKYCKILGQILLSAMRRTDAEVSLQDRYDEIKQLKKRVEQENIHLRKEIKVLYSHDEIIGKSQPIKTVLSQAEQVAEQETSVLVLGETGTGKELLARAIHDMSPRKKRAMITVNCAALPVTLIEGELFGREKGAYTGALTKQSGRFELADKSTVFLDEIGDLPLEMQVKLLRVLQEGQFERLGSAKTITVDVRVIAATNLDLEQAVREGRFRKDLFYRLSVFPITVPPLRDRTEDIPMLVWTFVKDFGKRMGKTVENIPDKTMDGLMSYTWPGNVRELRNLIERAMILHSGEILHIEKIQAEDQEIDQPTSLEEVERNHIRSVLAKKNWKVSGKNGAAEALGLKESTLRARMGKLGIKRGE